MSLILTPVQTSNGTFYRRKLGDNSNFNWFTCGCPVKDKKNNYVLRLSEKVQFYDTESGLTYKAKDDGCNLLLISNVHNKKKYSWLGKHCSDDTEQLSSTCSLLEHTESAYKYASRIGYCGVAYKSDTCTGFPDLICEGSVVIIDKKYMKRIRTCSYVTYAKNHRSYLKKVIPDFPSATQLNTLNDGELSKKLRELIFAQRKV